MSESFLTRPIFGDAEMAQCFDDTSLARAMLDVEAALARVEGNLDVIPQMAARAIAEAADRLIVEADSLETGVAAAGVPVPALVAALRAAAGPPHDDWVHWGATSQDIVDTAMSLICKTALALLQSRLNGLIDLLQVASRTHEATLMLARTRGQPATPITFGLRVAQWAQPLIALEAALPDLQHRALKVQFGGASGSQSVVAPDGPAIAKGLAQALGLAPSPPWHTDRAGLRHLARWLSTLVDANAKMAGDLILSGRGEIGEVRAGSGGGSSTMPHKSNPVTAEAILALSRVALACESGLSASAVHAEERDGGMWAVEWLLLPRLFLTAAAALRHAVALAGDLRPDATAMRAHLDATPQVLAEAAVFALAARVGRQKAAMLVDQALSASEPLKIALQKVGPDDIDWDETLDLKRFIAPAAEVARAVFSTRGKERDHGL